MQNEEKAKPKKERSLLGMGPLLGGWKFPENALIEMALLWRMAVVEDMGNVLNNRWYLDVVAMANKCGPCERRPCAASDIHGVYAWF
ncbi:MAG TPA: hypothetical protein VMV29_02890 [Ktedonobacterales bacterium]|nr:hypothetical protein [Ktedonobacterales bacterium]